MKIPDPYQHPRTQDLVLEVHMFTERTFAETCAMSLRYRYKRAQLGKPIAVRVASRKVRVAMAKFRLWTVVVSTPRPIERLADIPNIHQVKVP